MKKINRTNSKIQHPEALIFRVLSIYFPALWDKLIIDRTLYDDVRQIGWLAYLLSNGNFRNYWNIAQRELYALSKALGLRRTRSNKWIVREVREKVYDN